MKGAPYLHSDGRRILSSVRRMELDRRPPWESDKTAAISDTCLMGGDCHQKGHLPRKEPGKNLMQRLKMS